MMHSQSYGNFLNIILLENLTPVESEDDGNHDVVISSIVASASSIDKVKIVQAVQSLIRNTQQSTTARSENVKFRFRMKFKQQKGQPRRKSQLATVNGTSGPTAKPQPKIKLSPAKSNRSSRSPTSSVTSSSSSSTANNIRFQRDPHNSMERQRRVDLRVNFDKLKLVVPDVSSLEKASKLTILNKAANYCRLLSTSEARLSREWKLESAKNERLRKRLAALRR